MTTYTESLSLLNPTLFVNDQNINKPITELQGNIDYILNFINGNQSILPLIYGNLWDYTKDGNKFLSNGGNFSTYKKCQVWKALKDFNIVNDTDIIYDAVSNRCIYTATLDNNYLSLPNPQWIERELYIPQTLRNQSLILSLKASGCSTTDATTWTEQTALSEKIGIQIIGPSTTIEEFFTVGYWGDFNYFTDKINGPKMTTVHLPFKVDSNTSSVKVKIFRVAPSVGTLHIDKIFLGGLAIPYDVTDPSTLVETKYKLRSLDINELYDFNNGVSKFNATTLLGHKISEYSTTVAASASKASDVVINHTFFSNLRDILYQNSVVTLPTIPTSSQNFQYLSLVQGQLDCVVGQRIYTINHGVKKAQISPTVSLIAPSTFDVYSITGSAFSFYMTSIFDIQSSSFKVILSDAPAISGYKLSWTIGNALSPIDAIGYTPNPIYSSDVPITGNDIIFTYETSQLGV